MKLTHLMSYMELSSLKNKDFSIKKIMFVDILLKNENFCYKSLTKNNSNPSKDDRKIIHTHMCMYIHASIQ